MKRILYFLSCLVLASCTNHKPKNSPEAELESLFKKEFAATDAPGGSVLVKKGEKTVFLRSFGLADLETKEKITENTVFNTGSISKTFVSNGILVLSEKGLLTLEDPIFKYFNDFKNEDIAQKVKIKHLLSHTSGLPDLRKVSERIEFFLTAKDRENFEPLKQADSLHFEPGSRFRYSNPSYNGLALIIEELSEQPWQRFIEDHIFDPSGMTSSKITDGPYPQDGVAHAYVLKDNAYMEYDYGEFPTFAASGNGGIWSSVLDLAKYEKALRNNAFLSKALTEASRTRFRPESWADTLAPFVGYSWFIGEESLFGSESKFGVDMVYHTGSQGGFRAFYITIPEKDILFIGLFNRPLTDFRGLITESIKILEKYNWME